MLPELLLTLRDQNDWKKRWRCFRRRIARIVRDTYIPVSDLPSDALVARFIYNRQHMKPRSWHEIFDPEPCFPFELSVYESTNKTANDLKPLAPPRGDSAMKGFAVVPVAKINSIVIDNVHLKAIRYPHPHPDHANIINIPVFHKSGNSEHVVRAKRNVVKLQLKAAINEVIGV